MPTHKKPSPDVRQIPEQTDYSLKDFRKKVEANYAAFFNESLSPADEKRSLFHLWLHRSSMNEEPEKRT